MLGYNCTKSTHTIGLQISPCLTKPISPCYNNAPVPQSNPPIKKRRNESKPASTTISEHVWNTRNIRTMPPNTCKSTSIFINVTTQLKTKKRKTYHHHRLPQHQYPCQSTDFQQPWPISFQWINHLDNSSPVTVTRMISCVLHCYSSNN